MMLNVFSCTCWPSVCLLQKNVYSELQPIFNCFCNWVVNFSCILDVSPLSDRWLAKIFSHSGGTFSFCWFSLLCRSFSVWCGPTFLFLLLLFLLLVSDSKKSLPKPMPGILQPIFSSRTFMASYLTFKALINFELILCMVQDNGQILFFCKWLSQFSQHHY